LRRQNPMYLRLHHYTDKGKAVSHVTTSYSAFQRELNKCVVLCANCHRKTHAGLLKIEEWMVCNIEVPRLPRNPPPDLKAACRNRRTNRNISFQGRTMTLVEWGEETQVSPKTIRNRLCSGWPIDKALNHPPRIYRKKIRP
jgi:hypothetical protein